MKLFRNLREALINKGNLKRYLIYAIGEIFLVMIGISLAFQLDNWNENRIKESIEVKYYENIKDQLVGDKALIEEQKMFNNSYLQQFQYANQIIELNDRNRVDTLGLIIRNLTQYSDFDRQGNIYETMVNSGEIKLLKNKDIVDGIRVLEEKYLYINRMENIHYDAMMKHIILAINPVIKFSNGEIQKPDQIYNYEFQNLIISLIQVMNEKEQVYNEAIGKIDKVTDLINKELF